MGNSVSHYSDEEKDSVHDLPTYATFKAEDEALESSPSSYKPPSREMAPSRKSDKKVRKSTTEQYRLSSTESSQVSNQYQQKAPKEKKQAQFNGNKQIPKGKKDRSSSGKRDKKQGHQDKRDRSFDNSSSYMPSKNTSAHDGKKIRDMSQTSEEEEVVAEPELDRQQKSLNELAELQAELQKLMSATLAKVQNLEKMKAKENLIFDELEKLVQMWLISVTDWL